MHKIALLVTEEAPQANRWYEQTNFFGISFHYQNLAMRNQICFFPSCLQDQKISLKKARENGEVDG